MAEGRAVVYLTTSPTLWKLRGLQVFLQAPVLLAWPGLWVRKRPAQAVLAWGRKPSAQKAELLAKSLGLPVLRLEDGFLRSLGTGDRFPPLSLVVDDLGIYYDSTRPSRLEALLASDADVLAGLGDEVSHARAMLLEHGLSKYNHAGDGAMGSGVGFGVGDGWPRFARHGEASPARHGEARSDAADHGLALQPHMPRRVLVVDQTAGDMSVALGGASAQTFADMLAAARTENPQATIYVKTHPEVTTGRKRGYLTQEQDGVSASGQKTVVLRSLVNPLRLIEQMDRVYVVSSTMGFEALLAGKPVVCFGVPWYAGWGVTDDRCALSSAWARRNRKRSVDELFAGAFFHYTRYLNPLTHELGRIFDAMDWLVRQREVLGLASPATSGAAQEKEAVMARSEATRPSMQACDTHTGYTHELPLSGSRLLVVGFPRWRRYNLAPLFSLLPGRLHFVPNASRAAALTPGPADALVCWGRTAPDGLEALAAASGARLLRMEDGFVRGVGLGSDLLRPWSLVLDGRGIYFDPSGPSDLEVLLNTRPFTAQDLQRAQAVRAFMLAHGLTKYNLEQRQSVQWSSGGRPVVLVPGQVEDDASIRFGCTTVTTNMALLQAARLAQPGAFIVYKPHPDVASGNRRGRLALQAARQWADHVEAALSVVSCIEACDEVHTMTSLTGFDALLRGKRVVTYGQPFYAGWGLTHDRAGEGGASPPAFDRRTRRLSLDELVAGTMLHYPIYWDWALNGYTTCEAVLNSLLAQRTALESGPGLESLRSGWLRRQGRKLGVLWRAWTQRV